MISPHDALTLLIEGNRRFVSTQQAPPHATQSKREYGLPNHHAPFAVIIGCSDARVSPEIIFDQGLGTLFVVRVAGNIVGPTQRQSTTFAVTELGVRLIVVLGHTQCAALKATLDDLTALSQHRSNTLRDIKDLIHPAVQKLFDGNCRLDPDNLVRDAARLNVLAGVHALKRETPHLTPLIQSGDLMVIGAEYDISSGIVDFFDRSHP